jgi:hypothetical protein
VQAPLAQLPWYHHLALLDKLDKPADRLWYAAKAVEFGVPCFLAAFPKAPW